MPDQIQLKTLRDWTASRLPWMKLEPARHAFLLAAGGNAV
jgi:hypothetical protein